MPHEIGTVTNAGTHSLAHYNMLEAIRDLMLEADWTILRYIDDVFNHEVIARAPGLADDQEIFCGVRTYHSVDADYYNLTMGTFIGYEPSNTFESQPGARLSGVPAHNQNIDYWMTCNGQRLALAMKVGTPVYESGYIGYFLPFATPAQYPYPIVCAGMLIGQSATRFSDTTHFFGYKGNSARMGMRGPGGAYLNVLAHPWGNAQLMSTGSPSDNSRTMRPTGTSYKPVAITLRDSANLYGELDGILAITGFDNVVENTFTIDEGPHAGDYVVMQDVARTGFIDYYAMRLDPNPDP